MPHDAGGRVHVTMQAVYYRAADASEPVLDLVAALKPVEARVVVENQIDRLNLCEVNGPPLPFPHSSQVEGELRELRCHFGRELYRVLYRRSGNLFVLLHAFRKNTGPIPDSEIEVARQRWLDFKERMAAKPRKRPRALGHDAPR